MSGSVLAEDASVTFKEFIFRWDNKICRQTGTLCCTKDGSRQLAVGT